jgi:hypothetical protein
LSSLCPRSPQRISISPSFENTHKLNHSLLLFPCARFYPPVAKLFSLWRADVLKKKPRKRSGQHLIVLQSGQAAFLRNALNVKCTVMCIYILNCCFGKVFQHVCLSFFATFGFRYYTVNNSAVISLIRIPLNLSKAEKPLMSLPCSSSLYRMKVSTVSVLAKGLRVLSLIIFLHWNQSASL